MADVNDAGNINTPEVEVEKPTTKVETTSSEGEDEGTKETAKVLTEEEKEQARLDQENRTKKQSRLDRRFKELTGKVKAKEAEVQSWREALREVTGEAPPDREDYRTPEDYNAAVEEYREKIRGPKTMLEQAERDHGKAESEYVSALVESWNDKIEAAADELPDYQKVVKAAKVPMTSVMTKAILRSPVGPHIAFYLAQNQEEAYEILDLPADEQILEIGRLESKVQSGRKVVPGKTKTKSPNPPPSGVGPKGDIAPSKKDPKDMSLEEFTAWRKKGGGK